MVLDKCMKINTTAGRESPGIAPLKQILGWYLKEYSNLLQSFHHHRNRPGVSDISLCKEIIIKFKHCKAVFQDKITVIA